MNSRELRYSDIVSWQSKADIIDSLLDYGFQDSSADPEPTATYPLEFRGGSGAKLGIASVNQADRDKFALDLIDTYVGGCLYHPDSESVSIIGREDINIGSDNVLRYTFNLQEVRNESDSKYEVLSRMNKLDPLDAQSLSQVLDRSSHRQSFANEYRRVISEIQSAFDVDELTNAEEFRLANLTVQRAIYVRALEAKGILEYGRLEELYDNNLINGFPTSDLLHLIGPTDELKSKLDALPFLNVELFDTPQVCQDLQYTSLSKIVDARGAFDDLIDLAYSYEWVLNLETKTAPIQAVTPDILHYAIGQSTYEKAGLNFETPTDVADYIATSATRSGILGRLSEETGHEYESFADVFGTQANPIQSRNSIDWRDVSPDKEALATLSQEILPDLSIVAPTVGNGQLVLSALRLLVELHQSLVDCGLPADQLAEDHTSEVTKYRIAHWVATHNLYGTDIAGTAVDNCRFRILLELLCSYSSTERWQDSGIFHNYRRGDSLLGAPFSEPVQARISTDFPIETGSLNDYKSSLQRYRSGEIGFDEINTKLNEYSGNFRSAYTEALIESLSSKLTPKTLEPELQPWTLARRVIEQLNPIHWPLEFPTVFDRGGFDIVLSDPPANGYRHSTISEANRELEIEQDFHKKLSELSREVSQSSEYLEDSGRNYDAELHLLRPLDITPDSGCGGVFISADLFTQISLQPVRAAYLSHATLIEVLQFTNTGSVDSLHHGTPLSLAVFECSGTTTEFQSWFGRRRPQSFFDVQFVPLSKQLIEQYSRDCLIFPKVDSANQLEVLDQLSDFPALGDQYNEQEGWQVRLRTEIHQSIDSNLLTEEPTKGSHPVFRGRNIFQFQSEPIEEIDIDEVRLWTRSNGQEVSVSNQLRSRWRRELKQTLDSFIQKLDVPESSRKSQRARVNNTLNRTRGSDLSNNDVRLPSDVPRIAIRNIARATDERTVIASLLPRGSFHVNTLRSSYPYKIELNENLLQSASLKDAFAPRHTIRQRLVLLGLLNSIPFDYLIRRKVETHVSNALLSESSLPYVDADSEIFEEIWTRVAQLTLTGERFEHLRRRLEISAVYETNQRRELRAELDGIFLDLYQLSEDSVEYILSDFHRVRSPRIMDEEYFESVKEIYSDRSRREW